MLLIGAILFAIGLMILYARMRMKKGWYYNRFTNESVIAYEQLRKDCFTSITDFYQLFTQYSNADATIRDLSMCPNSISIGARGHIGCFNVPVRRLGWCFRSHRVLQCARTASRIVLRVT